MVPVAKVVATSHECFKMFKKFAQLSENCVLLPCEFFCWPMLIFYGPTIASVEWKLCLIAQQIFYWAFRYFHWSCKIFYWACNFDSLGVKNALWCVPGHVETFCWACKIFHWCHCPKGQVIHCFHITYIIWIFLYIRDLSNE